MDGNVLLLCRYEKEREILRPNKFLTLIFTFKNISQSYRSKNFEKNHIFTLEIKNRRVSHTKSLLILMCPSKVIIIQLGNSQDQCMKKYYPWCDLDQYQDYHKTAAKFSKTNIWKNIILDVTLTITLKVKSKVIIISLEKFLLSMTKTNIILDGTMKINFKVKSKVSMIQLEIFL